jgi:hypothetical protein
LYLTSISCGNGCRSASCAFSMCADW